MGIKLNYDEIRYVMYQTSGRIADWQGQLQTLQSKIQILVNMNSFKGETADNIKNYLNEVHLAVAIPVIANMLCDYQQKILLYDSGLSSIDSDIHAHLVEATLKKADKYYETSEVYDLGVDLGSELDSISDIVFISKPYENGIETSYNTLSKKINDLIDKMTNYESSKKNNEISQLEDLIIATNKVILNMLLRTEEDLTKYASGDCSKIEGFTELADELARSILYQDENVDKVNDAAEYQQEVAAELQKEYEEAVKRREDEATAQGITAVVTMIAGAAAIVLTAGAATPVVVAVAVTGGCTILYGASNLYEAADSYSYAVKGDVYTEAFNPIRDTVFQGNQTYYDIWGNTNMILSSVIAPTGEAVSAYKAMRASGQTFKQVFTTIGVTYGKEVVFGQVKDYAVGEGINIAGDIVGLSETEKALLNAGYNLHGIKKNFDGAFKDESSFNKIKEDYTPKVDTKVNPDLDHLAELARVDMEVKAHVDEIEAGLKTKSTEDIPKVKQSENNKDINYFDKAETKGEAWKNYFEDTYGADNVDWVINSADEAKINSWKYTPSKEQYLKNKSVYDNPNYFNQKTGEAIYPGTVNPSTNIKDINEAGFTDGYSLPDVIKAGSKINRYGDNGNAQYFSPENTSWGERALPPRAEKTLLELEVLKDIPCSSGEIAPWFDQPGGGLQLYTDTKIKSLSGEMVDANLQNLIANKYVKIISK